MPVGSCDLAIKGHIPSAILYSTRGCPRALRIIDSQNFVSSAHEIVAPRLLFAPSPHWCGVASCTQHPRYTLSQNSHVAIPSTALNPFVACSSWVVQKGHSTIFGSNHPTEFG